jgi:hypothetical protein
MRKDAGYKKNEYGTSTVRGKEGGKSEWDVNS